MVGYRDVWVYTFLYQNLVIIYVSEIVLTFLHALLTCNSFSRISRPWWQILGIPSVAHAVPRHLLLLKWVFLCLCSFPCHFQAVFLCKQYLLLLSLWRQVRSVTIRVKCFKKHSTGTGTNGKNNARKRHFFRYNNHCTMYRKWCNTRPFSNIHLLSNKCPSKLYIFIRRPSLINPPCLIDAPPPPRQLLQNTRK